MARADRRKSNGPWTRKAGSGRGNRNDIRPRARAKQGRGAGWRRVAALTSSARPGAAPDPRGSGVIRRKGSGAGSGARQGLRSSGKPCLVAVRGHGVGWELGGGPSPRRHEATRRRWVARLRPPGGATDVRHAPTWDGHPGPRPTRSYVAWREDDVRGPAEAAPGRPAPQASGSRRAIQTVRYTAVPIVPAATNATTKKRSAPGRSRPIHADTAGSRMPPKPSSRRRSAR